MKRKIFSLFALLFILCSVISGCSSSTPEAAIANLFQALSDHKDQEELWAFCPAEQLSEGYTPRAGNIPSTNSPPPEKYRLNFQQQLLVKVTSLLYEDTGGYDFWPPEIDDPAAIPPEEYVLYTNSMVAHIEAPIKVIRCDFPLSEDSEKYNYTKDMWNRYADSYQAEDSTERVILIEYKGKTYLIGCILIKYNGDWGIVELYSHALSMSEGTPCIPMSEEEYNQNMENSWEGY